MAEEEAKNLETPVVEEPTTEEPDIEEIKNQLAEREAELAEEKAVKAYEDDVREANSQLDTFLNNLGNAMVQEFKRYGIDPNSNLDELREKDPAKANVAERIIKQAQEVKASGFGRAALQDTENARADL